MYHYYSKPNQIMRQNITPNVQPVTKTMCPKMADSSVVCHFSSQRPFSKVGLAGSLRLVQISQGSFTLPSLALFQWTLFYILLLLNYVWIPVRLMGLFFSFSSTKRMGPDNNEMTSEAREQGVEIHFSVKYYLLLNFCFVVNFSSFWCIWQGNWGSVREKLVMFLLC